MGLNEHFRNKEVSTLFLSNSREKAVITVEVGVMLSPFYFHNDTESKLLSNFFIFIVLFGWKFLELYYNVILAKAIGNENF